MVQSVVLSVSVGETGTSEKRELKDPITLSFKKKFFIQREKNANAEVAEDANSTCKFWKFGTGENYHISTK